MTKAHEALAKIHRRLSFAEDRCAAPKSLPQEVEDWFNVVTDALPAQTEAEVLTTEQAFEQHLNPEGGRTVVGSRVEIMITAADVIDTDLKLRLALIRVAVCLMGAKSLLESGPKTNTPPDLIFDQIMKDYEEAIKIARKALGVES